MAPKEPNDFFFKKGFFLIKKKWIKMEDVKCGQSNQTVAEYAFEIAGGGGHSQGENALFLRPLCSHSSALPDSGCTPGIRDKK